MQAIKSKSSLLKRTVSSKLPLMREASLMMTHQQRMMAASFKQSLVLNQEFEVATKKTPAFQQYQQIAGQPRPKKTQQMHMGKGSIPLDRAGIIALPKIQERELVSEYLKSQHISEEHLTEHFTTMFQSFLSNLVSKNYSALEKVTEKRFLSALASKAENLDKFQLKYTPSSDDEFSTASYMIDQMLVRGVKFARNENDSNHDYMYVDTLEHRGLRFYLHKYFLGFHPYYIQSQN